jgi:hypothetical protein
MQQIVSIHGMNAFSLRQQNHYNYKSRFILYLLHVQWMIKRTNTNYLFKMNKISEINKDW